MCILACCNLLKHAPTRAACCQVIVTPPRLGEFSIAVSLAGELIGGGERFFTATCPAGKARFLSFSSIPS